MCWVQVAFEILGLVEVEEQVQIGKVVQLAGHVGQDRDVEAVLGDDVAVGEVGISS